LDYSTLFREPFSPVILSGAIAKSKDLANFEVVT